MTYKYAVYSNRPLSDEEKAECVRSIPGAVVVENRVNPHLSDETRALMLLNPWEIHEDGLGIGEAP